MLNQINTVSIVRFKGTDPPNKTNAASTDQSLQNKVIEKAKDKGKDVIDNIPLAKKAADNKNRTFGTLSFLTLGGVLAPMLGTAMDSISGLNSPIVKAAQKISDKTIKFDSWFKGLNAGNKIHNALEPIKLKLLGKTNLEILRRNAHKTTFLETSRVLRDNALSNGNRLVAHSAIKTVQTIEQTSNLGILGKSFAKGSMILKKNLSGTSGIVNGLFAAMTVNDVIKAKEGEKLSTFMETLMGAWVGSMVGYRAFENVLLKVMDFVPKKGAAKIGTGFIPKLATVVSKLPAKGLLIPMAGAILVSSMMQKISHAVFGKPTKKDPVVIDSVDSLQNYLVQSGWVNVKPSNYLEAQK